MILSIRASRRRGAALVAVTLAAVGLSSCAVANSGSSGPASPSTVRIVLPQEPPTLEPCDSSLTSTGVVVRSNITQPLVERDPTSGKLEPLLATGWRQVSGTTWRFTLRPGVTFSDGTPFDAKAAAFAIDRVLTTSLGCNVQGYVFGDAKLTTEVVDANTLDVSTAEPDPILPLRLSFVEIVPPSTGTAKKARVPIGTGPYQVARWDAGEKLVLTRNPKYWDQAPSFQTAEYQWRDEGSVRAAMVTNGEADVVTNLSPEDGAGDLGVTFPNNETTALRITGTYAPLNDLRVRQAINYAIDRASIVKALFEGDAIVAAQLVPDGVVGHDPQLQPWPYDPDKARKLIAEAKADGVPTDTRIRLISRNGLFPKVDIVMQVVQQELAEIGLNAKIEMFDTAASLPYQVRPFPAKTGPYVMLVQHGNQAGDTAFSVDQYMVSDGAQSTFGTPALDARIAAAGRLQGQARQDAYARIFTTEPTEIGQFAYIAHMTGVLGKGADIDYEPDSATGDEMHLADMSRK
ncbi:ABC transporter substrate-binding protein [Kribbella amoyensis]|nr:ABC transporter substrate-binding protein [Kribbella amoyensis]